VTGSPDTARDLVARARGGSREAFEELVRLHAGLVVAVLAAHLPGTAEIEDLVQETFMTAWGELRHLRRPESFGPWVSAIARNLARSSAAETARRREGAPRTAAAVAPAAGREALYRRVLGEVERLPEGYREVLLLRYVQERSCEEVAAALGLPLGTVTSRLSRGHALLRERLGPEAGT
jgi:RNA polymerase sigma-70 factor (ECF subfamily)